MQLWWILILCNSCPCIQLLSGGLAYMFYEYYLCKVVKKGIKMLSIHHCQLFVRQWNKVIRMWHKGTMFFPFALFTSWYKTVSLNTCLIRKKCTQQMQLKEERKVYLPLCFQGCSPSWWGSLWWQEQEMVGHIVPTVEKQRVMNPGIQLAFLFLISLRQQPME